MQSDGYTNVIARTCGEVDLCDRSAVLTFFESERPEFIVDAAARVGGIQANDKYPADFIRDNIVIQMNLIDAAFRAGTGKFLFLSSLCIYPTLAPQPIIVKFTGKLRFDTSMPDGTPRKLLDVSRLARSGWTYRIELQDGIRSTYDWFLKHHSAIRT